MHPSVAAAFRTDPLVAITPPGHGLNGRPGLTFNELVAENPGRPDRLRQGLLQTVNPMRSAASP
jgi:hypothetical protein